MTSNLQTELEELNLNINMKGLKPMKSNYEKTETIHPYSGVNSGSRNKTASTYTRKLMMEGCSRDVAMGILYEWNETNYPPLEINELQRTFESNLKYADTFELSKTGISEPI